MLQPLGGHSITFQEDNMPAKAFLDIKKLSVSVEGVAPYPFDFDPADFLVRLLRQALPNMEVLVGSWEDCTSPECAALPITFNLGLRRTVVSGLILSQLKKLCRIEGVEGHQVMAIYEKCSLVLGFGLPEEEFNEMIRNELAQVVAVLASRFAQVREEE